MTLSEMVRERGRLLSILDLVEWMEEFDLDLIGVIHAAYSVCVNNLDYDNLGLGTDLYMELLPDRTDKFATFCAELGLSATLASLRRVQQHHKYLRDNAKAIYAKDRDAVEAADAYTRFLVRDLQEMAMRFRDEMASHKLMYIELPRLPFWNENDKNMEGKNLTCHIDDDWKAILTKLPAASRDLIHAGKCYACSEYTASVLHLCRIFEFAFKDFITRHSITLSRNIDEFGWERLAGDLQRHINSANPPLYFAEVNAVNWVRDNILLLATLWRNETAHATGAFYDDVENMAIYHAVKSFVKTIVNLEVATDPNKP